MKWISCKKKKPSDSHAVLCWGNGGAYEAYWDGKSWNTDERGAIQKAYWPTHWIEFEDIKPKGAK